MKNLRWIFAWPFLLLQVVFVLLKVLLEAGSKGLYWLSFHSTKHLYWPMVVGKRIALGLPRWKVVDLLYLGRQPITAADKAIAAADQSLAFCQCHCGRADCEYKDGYYMPKTNIAPTISAD